MSQAEPILVMSRFVGSAWLKMAQLGWLSHFEPSRGITRRGFLIWQWHFGDPFCCLVCSHLLVIVTKVMLHSRDMFT